MVGAVVEDMGGDLAEGVLELITVEVGVVDGFFGGDLGKEGGPGAVEKFGGRERRLERFFGHADAGTGGGDAAAEPDPLGEEEVDSDFFCGFGVGELGEDGEPVFCRPEVVVEVQVLHRCSILHVDEVSLGSMTQTELLDGSTRVVEDLLVRLPRALEGLTADQMSRPAPGGPWSLAGIVDHMTVSMEPYLSAVEPLLVDGGAEAGRPVSNTFMGKMITRGAGPEGNVPAFGATLPRVQAYDDGVLEAWTARHRQFLTFAERARSADLSQRFRNPFISFLRMNVVDFFTILPAHGERHVRQIEERRAGVLSVGQL